MGVGCEEGRIGKKRLGRGGMRVEGREGGGCSPDPDPSAPLPR